MTGQVDEAGWEARAERYAAAWRISRGLSVQAWDPFIALADTEQSELRAEVAGLRTQLAERDARIETLVRISNVNGDWNIKYANLQDDRDRLAGQVAAIRALCDEHDRRSFNDLQRSRTADIRAALVASSPTTP